MFDKLKDIKKISELNKEIEKTIKNTNVISENDIFKVSGNANEALDVNIKINISEITEDKLKKDIIDILNKYMKKANTEKESIMKNSIGGLSGVMDMIKGLK